MPALYVIDINTTTSNVVVVVKLVRSLFSVSCDNY